MNSSIKELTELRVLLVPPLEPSFSPLPCSLILVHGQSAWGTVLFPVLACTLAPRPDFARATSTCRCGLACLPEVRPSSLSLVPDTRIRWKEKRLHTEEAAKPPGTTAPAGRVRKGSSKVMQGDRWHLEPWYPHIPQVRGEPDRLQTSNIVLLTT